MNELIYLNAFIGLSRLPVELWFM